MCQAAGRDRVELAFERVGREYFLPRAQRRRAGQDHPLPIGHRQTNSQPSTVREMLVLLEVAPGHRVLDVGAGSGWTTALLGDLVGPQGSVLGLELVPELARWGARNLATQQMPWARLEPADPEVLGAPDRSPFDRILVSAEARLLPEELVDQLAVGGVMVVPVAGRMNVVRRTATGREVSRVGHYAFVPLLTPRVCGG